MGAVRGWRRLLGGAVVLGCWLGFVGAASAATLTVTTTADHDDGTCDADCTLREAVNHANPGDVIIVPSGTYLLTLGELDVTNSVAIEGAGARSTTISAGSSSRVVQVESGANLTVSGVTVTGGSADVGGGFDVAGGGTLALTDSTVAGNTATISGGGIDTNGAVSILRSTIAGNSTTGPGYSIGAGIDCFCTLVTVTDSTVTDNTATGGTSNQGGGILYSSANALSVSSSTISGNSAAGGGGGVYLYGGGSGAVTNTIIAGNTGGDCNAAVGTLGHNLSSDQSCGFTGNGDLQSMDPLLGALQDNGGPTDTRALTAGSPAIDAGDTANCPAIDQRGVARPQGLACDIGAYEAASGTTTTPTAALSVVITGGSGSVGSSPAGIDCGSTCKSDFPAGSVVTLSATPASGYVFLGWSGACSGLGSCTVTMSADTAVAAKFAQVITATTQALVQPYYVEVSAGFSPSVGQNYEAWIDYGTDTGYGLSTSKVATGVVQGGESITSRFYVAPQTTYHYRLHLVSLSSGAEFIGPDRSATTPAAPTWGPCTAGFSSGSSGYSYRLCGAPDLDQVRVGQVPGDGFMFCVPTSTVDLFGYLAQKIPGLAPGDHDWTVPANFQLGSQEIARMGAYMGTSTSGGTNTAGLMQGLNSWLVAAGTAGQGLVYSNLTPDQSGLLPISALSQAAANGDLVMITIGFYGSAGNRIGGHEVLMTGLRGAWDQSSAELSINDPFTPALADDVQSTASADALSIAMGKVGQDTLPILSGYSYPWFAPIEAIDQVTVIGSQQVVSASPGRLVLSTVSQLVPGTSVQQRITLPGSPLAVAQPAGSNTVDYLTASLAHAARGRSARQPASTARSAGGALIEVDLRTHHQRLLARGLHAPSGLIIGGPHQWRYVLDGGGISAIDSSGRRRAHRRLRRTAEAGIAWDASRQALGVILPRMRRLELLSATLRPTVSAALPARILRPGHRVDLGFTPNGRVVIHPENTRSYTVLSLHPARHHRATALHAISRRLAVIPGGFGVDSAGRLLVNLGGRVFPYSLNGQRIGGVLAKGMPTGTNIAILQSSHTLTAAQAKLPLELPADAVAQPVSVISQQGSSSTA